jgi:uncharacterized protein (DUF952 family)
LPDRFRAEGAGDIERTSLAQPKVPGRPGPQYYPEAMSTPAALPKTIYRILTEQAWAKAQAAGAFSGSEHDVRDGFIHFSTAAQVAETAAKHYARMTDLVLLWVDVEPIAHALRWEVSRGGALFPHLYAELPSHAVRRAALLELDANGVHVLPAALE